MSRPDEGLIHAWLDGEVSAEEAARIERLVATDAEWAAAVAEARGLIAASSRIVKALDAVPTAMPSGTRASGTSGAASRGAGFSVRPWMRIAAGVVLVVGTTVVLQSTNESLPGTQATSDARTPVNAEPTPTAEAVAPASPLGAMDSTPPAESRKSTTSMAPTSPAARTPETLPAVAATSAAPADAGPPVRSDAGGAAPPTAQPTAEPSAPAPARMQASREGERQEAVAELSRERDVARRAAPTQPFTVPTTQAAGSPAASPRPLADGRTGDDFSGIGVRTLGCWTVTAPDSLRGMLREPIVVRLVADTTTLRLASGAIVRVRVRGDTLSGDLSALRTACPE